MIQPQPATKLRRDVGEILERLESLLQALRVVTIAREDQRRDDATSASMFLLSEIEVNLMALGMELKGPEIFEPANDDERQCATEPEVSTDNEADSEAGADENSTTELTEDA